MRKVAEVWTEEAEIAQHAVGRLPWGHITVLLDRLDTRDDRDWYAARAADEGWSRAVLEHLSMVTTRRECDVEQALTDRLQDTLMELGRGMSLVGRQFRLPPTRDCRPTPARPCRRPSSSRLSWTRRSSAVTATRRSRGSGVGPARAGETWLPADPSTAKLALVSADRARLMQGTYP